MVVEASYLEVNLCYTAIGNSAKKKQAQISTALLKLETVIIFFEQKFLLWSYQACLEKTDLPCADGIKFMITVGTPPDLLCQYIRNTAQQKINLQHCKKKKNGCTSAKRNYFLEGLQRRKRMCEAQFSY